MVIATFTEKPHRSPPGTGAKLPDPAYSRGYYSFYPTESWTPNVNLYETDRSYVVCVDLAGVDKAKIEVEVIDGRLTLRGKRAVPVTPENPSGGQSARIRVHLMEIDHGAFARDVELPEDVHQ
ncbi:MAG: Hsp20/alpha crystallin family protein, partial [Tepidisphaeraceae bacterium]